MMEGLLTGILSLVLMCLVFSSTLLALFLRKHRARTRVTDYSLLETKELKAVRGLASQEFVMLQTDTFAYLESVKGRVGQ